MAAVAEGKGRRVHGIGRSRPIVVPEWKSRFADIHIDHDSTTVTILRAGGNGRMERPLDTVSQLFPTIRYAAIMEVCQVGSLVRVDCPAKLNLFLEVLAKRPDGFHEIETLMVAISIFDSLIVTANREGRIRVTCDWAFGMEARRARSGDSGLVPLPPAANNLVTIAGERLRVRTGIEQGATLQLIKRIPSEAGLGGASSDAAAALLALNAIWRLGWSRDQLAEFAAELGSDVPFFLLGRQSGAMAALARGKGERISAIAGVPRLPVVVVKPPEGLSTAVVYRQCVVPREPASAGPLVAALRAGQLTQVGSALFNRLQEVGERMSPWVSRLRRTCEQLDVVGHAMSGSGTSYFAVCRTAAHARFLAARLKATVPGQVFHLSTV